MSKKTSTENTVPRAAKIALVTALMGLALAAPFSAKAVSLVADYTFNNNLNSSVGGAPALVPTNPLGLNGFGTATVFGNIHPVYNYVGNATPVNQQAGLTLDTTGLISANSYSVQVVVSMQNINGWRRLVDVQNRQSDNGFYYDPSHHLDVFPVAGGGTMVAANTFEDVVLTVAPNGTVKGYLNNDLEFTTVTPVMNINNPGNLMNFFLDNVVGGGQGEFSSGSVAEIKLYSGTLTDQEVANLDVQPLSPVPDVGSTLTLMSLAMGTLVGFCRKLRRRQ